MKYADAKNDAERVEVLFRALTLARGEYIATSTDSIVEAIVEEVHATGYQGIPLPGDEEPDGTVLTRATLDMEEAYAALKAGAGAGSTRDKLALARGLLYSIKFGIAAEPGEIDRVLEQTAEPEDDGERRPVTSAPSYVRLREAALALCGAMAGSDVAKAERERLLQVLRRPKAAPAERTFTATQLQNIAVDIVYAARRPDWAGGDADIDVIIRKWAP